MQPTIHLRSTRALLACGVICGPLFYIGIAAQMATRAGFDIRHHPLSLLSLGSAGWIQIANFILTGVIALGFAIGLRRALRGTAAGSVGPVLFAVYGLGMIVAGVFSMDPAFGFPPGTPDTVPTVLSLSAKLHGVGFFMAFGSLTAACFVFGRRFRILGERGWSRYCIITGVVTPLLVAVGMVIQSATSLLFAFVGLVAFGWMTAMAANLMAVRCRSIRSSFQV